MAIVALQHRVGADQGKPVLVILNLLQRHLPASYRVATLAIRTKLPAMYVRMTVRATAADFLEDQTYMALGARDFGMHAAQRITRLIMVEFRIRPNWLPARVGMALLARNRQGSVRIGNLRLRAADGRTPVIGRLLRRRAEQHDYEGNNRGDEPACVLHLNFPHSPHDLQNHSTCN